MIDQTSLELSGVSCFGCLLGNFYVLFFGLLIVKLCLYRMLNQKQSSIDLNCKLQVHGGRLMVRIFV